METQLLARITVDPEISFGKPTIRNLRYSVALILDLLSEGMSTDELLADYPDLERDDIRACLLFASKLIQVGRIQKVVAA